MFINVTHTPLISPVGFAVTTVGPSGDNSPIDGLRGSAVTGFLYLYDCIILRDSDGNPVLDSNGNPICLPA